MQSKPVHPPGRLTEELTGRNVHVCESKRCMKPSAGWVNVWAGLSVLGAEEDPDYHHRPPESPAGEETTHLHLGAFLLLPWLLLPLLHLTVGSGAVELGHVQALIDAARDGLDVGDQLLLDGLQVEPVVRGDEVDGQAQVTEPPCKRVCV